MKKHQEHHLNVQLVYTNKTYGDILFKEELDGYLEEGILNKITYTLTRNMDEKWKGRTGRVDLEMLTNCLPKPSKDTFIHCCGPFKNNVGGVRDLLEAIGHKFGEGFYVR